MIYREKAIKYIVNTLERSEDMQTRGIEHIAITVPDVDEATDFFIKAFQATILYDGHTPSDPPVQGLVAEAVFGIPSGGRWIHRRILSVGPGPRIELFQYETQDQRSASRTFDYGLQHIAFYVDDLIQATQDFVSAGGRLYPAINQSTGRAGEVTSKHGWVYGETPWGTIVELVTFPT